MLHPSDLIGKQIDQFRLDDFIAKGAMGMVFKAFDTVLVRTVALKLISRQLLEELTQEEVSIRKEARNQLIQEAKTAGRLNHPNILTIYSYGETDDFEYICMEYLKGRTLSQVLSEKKVIDVDHSIPILDQILLALEAASKEGIVHRDIKPSNIMITEDGRVKVMDFGIAKLPSFSMTTTGTVLGTPYYMSPEQISGHKVDIRSDIFSVGAVLYQMVTGERPFEATNTATLAYKIVQVDPIPPDVINVHVPYALSLILKKALAKTPSERYQIPFEMMQDLKAFKEKKPLPSQVGSSASSSHAKGWNGSIIKDARMASASAGIQGSPDGYEAAVTGEVSSPRIRVVEFRRPGGAGGTGEAPQPPVHGEDDCWISPEGEDPTLQATLDGEQLPSTRHVAQLVPSLIGSERYPAHDHKRYRFVGILFVLVVVAGFWYVAFNAFREIRGVGKSPVGSGGTLPDVKTQLPASAALSPPATSQGDASPGTHAASSSDESSGSASVERLIQEAKSLWPSDPAKAQKLLEKAVSLQPDHFEASFQLARLLAHRMDYAAARQQYEKTLLLNKSNPEVYFNLGHIHLTQGDYDAAIKNLEACLALHPSYKDEVLANLGIAYLKTDRLDQAREAFRKAVEVNAANAVAKAHLAALSSEEAGGSAPKPTEEGKAASSVDLLVAQAKNLMEDDPSQARKLLDEAIQRDPNGFEAIFQLGRLLTFQKDYPAAIQNYERALSLNPASADALFNLGYIHLVSRNYDQAIQYYESCLALGPPYRDEVLTNLGLSHLKKANPARARKLFEEALEINPENRVAQGYLRNMDKPRQSRLDIQLPGAPGEVGSRQAPSLPAADPKPAEAKPATPQPLEGDYLVEGVNPSGSTYKGKASLKREGNGFIVTWVIANVKFSGKGSMNGDILAVNWQTSTGQSGSVSYQLGQDGILRGSWADGMGGETLVPVRR